MLMETDKQWKKYKAKAWQLEGFDLGVKFKGQV